MSVCFHAFIKQQLKLNWRRKEHTHTRLQRYVNEEIPNTSQPTILNPKVYKGKKKHDILLFMNNKDL